MQYLIGLDNGGTMTKAAVFDTTGREIGVAWRQTPMLTPKPGYTERDMELLWEMNCECIREVLSAYSISPDQVAGLAIAGHGKGLYLWGKDEKPAYNGIVSTDNRAWKYPDKWRENGVFDALYPKLCQQILPGQQASLLAWMKKHEPTVYDNIRWVFSVKDYIRFRLTDQAFSEVTDISGSALMNVRDASIDGELLAELGISEITPCIPPLRYSSDFCGAITANAAAKTGLKEGTPVAGGMFDIDACAIAMDVTDSDQLCTITGTWTINEFISKQPVTGTEIAMNSLYAMPGYYLIEECSATGAGNLEWALENIQLNCPEGMKPYVYADKLVGDIDPADCDVYFLPFLYGSNDHALAKASFVGLTTYHNSAHMLRAVYEGAAYSAKMHIDRLLSVRNAPKAIRLAGGVANSAMWVQMYADIIGLPIETVTGVKELGALGCAMAAAVAAGVYKDYTEAAKAMVKVAAPVMPNPERSAVYQAKYAKYTAVRMALTEVWNKFEV